MLSKQSTMLFEQSRVALLHLLQERQEVAIAFQKALLGCLRKSPGAVDDQSWPVQPQPHQREVTRGGPWVETTFGQQQQVPLARIVSWFHRTGAIGSDGH